MEREDFVMRNLKNKYNTKTHIYKIKRIIKKTINPN